MNIETTGGMVRIWSDYHKAWWRANSSGYTPFRADAGIYSAEEADRISSRDRKHVPIDDPWDPIAESREVTKRIDAAVATLTAERDAARGEVSALKADLAKARGLMIERMPTIGDVMAHPHGWLFLYEGSQVYMRVHTQGRAFSLVQGGSLITHAIPLDANGQPCPVGGWSDPQ